MSAPRKGKKSPPRTHRFSLESFVTSWLKRNEPQHLTTGRWGEKVAARFLRKHGYRIVGQRVQVGRRDELDIIARQGDAYIFVEVKTRKNEQFGRPYSAVNNAKKKHLSRAAVHYLKGRKIKPDFIRFDVIEVIGIPKGDPPEIRHIENAFPLDAAYRLWW